MVKPFTPQTARCHQCKCKASISADASSLSESSAPKGDRTISHRKPPQMHLSWTQVKNTAGVFHSGDDDYPLAVENEVEVPSGLSRPVFVLQVQLWEKGEESEG